MARTLTIRVDDVLTEVNRRLEVSTCSPEVRQGMASVLEWILMETGNYGGFGYLPSAGLSHEECEGLAISPRVVLADDSRIVFYKRR